MTLPKEDLEGRTNVSECAFDALCKGVSTRFGKDEQKMKSGFSNASPLVRSPHRVLSPSSTHTLEKWFENPHFIFCSAFPNLHLGGMHSMLPKRRQTNTQQCTARTTCCPSQQVSPRYSAHPHSHFLHLATRTKCFNIIVDVSR